MLIPEKHKNKYFYHFTHLDNIESIVNHGLLSTNEKIRQSISHTNLANASIQLRRSEMIVTCPPYGIIHDYVPFYFTTLNPMLLGILNRKIIDQQNVVFIVISIDKLLASNVVFTDASANTTIKPNFFSDPIDLDRLNWKSIYNTKWKAANPDDLHIRMAEVLIHKSMNIEWIDSFVVFNDIAKNKIQSIYENNGLAHPKIYYQPFQNNYFFFTKFFFQDRKNETLVTGPRTLKNEYENVFKYIKSKRSNGTSREFVFNNIEDSIQKIHLKFDIIPELIGIFNLTTENPLHKETVSDHTIKVVNNLSNNEYYEQLSLENRNIVKLAAYLHDIGKGPKSKWENEIQKAYPDHPADAIPMLARILTCDFKEISDYEIKLLCLLVIYHDIIGDIINNERDINELVNLNIDHNEINMLIALNVADISAINHKWEIKTITSLPEFIEKLKNI